MDWIIEPLKTDDMHEFWSTFKDVLQSEFPGYTKKVVDHFLKNLYSERNFHYYLQTGQKSIFVAKINGTIVGFAVIDEPYGGVSLCRWLGVKRELQKQGIGSALIQTWLELAKKQGCHKAEVAAQPEAKEFYEKVGLALEGKRKKSYFGIDQYIFGQVLAEPKENFIIGSR